MGISDEQLYMDRILTGNLIVKKLCTKCVFFGVNMDNTWVLYLAPETKNRLGMETKNRLEMGCARGTLYYYFCFSKMKKLFWWTKNFPRRRATVLSFLQRHILIL